MTVHLVETASALPDTRGRVDVSSGERPDRRVSLLQKTLALACFSGFVFSTKLWLSARSYPATPVFGASLSLPPPLDLILFVSVLAFLLLGAATARPSRYTAGFLLLATFLVLSDQSRLQPWFYQYFFMIAAFWVGSRDTSGAGRQTAVLNTCRLILISIYFWSGVQKINVTFLDRVFPALIERYLNVAFGVGEESSSFLILFVPLVEVGIAIGLLIRRFRDAAVCVAVVTHLFILMLFVPVWRNSVVWPWNVAMVGFSVILFWRSSEFSVRDILVPSPLSIHMFVLILFGMMPLFSFLGSWDSYLSFSLYSGNVAIAGIHVSDRTIERLPPAIRVQVEQRQRYDGRAEIDLNKWSLRELNVPTYPERRVFRSVTKRICKYAEHPSDVTLTVYERPDWLTGFREVYIYNCSSLGS